MEGLKKHTDDGEFMLFFNLEWQLTTRNLGNERPTNVNHYHSFNAHRFQFYYSIWVLGKNDAEEIRENTDLCSQPNTPSSSRFMSVFLVKFTFSIRLFDLILIANRKVSPQILQNSINRSTIEIYSLAKSKYNNNALARLSKWVDRNLVNGVFST